MTGKRMAQERGEQERCRVEALQEPRAASPRAGKGPFTDANQFFLQEIGACWCLRSLVVSPNVLTCTPVVSEISEELELGFSRLDTVAGSRAELVIAGNEGFKPEGVKVWQCS